MNHHRLCLVGLALLAAGCVGPTQVAERPATLDHVNSVLEGAMRALDARIRKVRALLGDSEDYARQDSYD